MSAIRSCNHREDGLATDKNSSNRWAGEWHTGPGWVEGRGPIIWITCPKKWRRFITYQRASRDALWNWAYFGFPNGAVVWDGILWVVAPDPGCEL